MAKQTPSVEIKVRGPLPGELLANIVKDYCQGDLQDAAFVVPSIHGGYAEDSNGCHTIIAAEPDQLPASEVEDLVILCGWDVVV
jgi:hypothetical protein